MSLASRNSWLAIARSRLLPAERVMVDEKRSIPSLKAVLTIVTDVRQLIIIMSRSYWVHLTLARLIAITVNYTTWINQGKL